MERLEGDMSPKNPVTPPGIDPGTVGLIVQRLNHYATPGPKSNLVHPENEALLPIILQPLRCVDRTESFVSVFLFHHYVLMCFSEHET